MRSGTSMLRRVAATAGLVAVLALVGAACAGSGETGNDLLARPSTYSGQFPYETANASLIGAPNGKCRAPELPGSIVTVREFNKPSTTGGSDTMGIVIDPNTVRAGDVSFVVANMGTIQHELIILPLPDGQSIDQFPVGSDNKVSEDTKITEASNSCGEGAGEGIDPGSLSWVTTNLAPGNYALICNIAGHYAAGMRVELHVS